jgi:hypothetical protein
MVVSHMLGAKETCALAAVIHPVVCKPDILRAASLCKNASIPRYTTAPQTDPGKRCSLAAHGPLLAAEAWWGYLANMC